VIIGSLSKTLTDALAFGEAIVHFISDGSDWAKIWRLASTNHWRTAEQCVLLCPTKLVFCSRIRRQTRFQNYKVKVNMKSGLTT